MEAFAYSTGGIISLEYLVSEDNILVWKIAEVVPWTLNILLFLIVFLMEKYMGHEL